MWGGGEGRLESSCYCGRMDNRNVGGELRDNNNDQYHHGFTPSAT
jgi:hypothetical protein